MPSMLDLLPSSSGYGFRQDGTRKGQGYFGPLEGAEGTSTELSFDFDSGGRNIHAPLLVPTLNQAEIQHLLGGGQPTEEIYLKAIQHAMDRRFSGKPAFARPTDIVRLPK